MDPLNMKTATLSGKMYSVVSLDEFQQNRDLYSNTMTAVEVPVENGESTILPFRSGTNVESRPGVYVDGSLTFVHKAENPKEYQPDEVINFSNQDDIVEYANKCNMKRSMEMETLVCTDPSEYYVPPISGKESPEMLALKQAVIAKKIDLDRYSDRFGDNYPNDKRQFRSDTITLFMLKRMCTNLDMNAKLIIEDANPNVINPIGHQISVDLFGKNNDTESENNEG